MNENWSIIALNLLSVFIAACSQVILKKSAMNRQPGSVSYFVNPATISAYGMFFGCMVLTFYFMSFMTMITVKVMECSS